MTTENCFSRYVIAEDDVVVGSHTGRDDDVATRRFATAGCAGGGDGDSMACTTQRGNDERVV